MMSDPTARPAAAVPIAIAIGVVAVAVAVMLASRRDTGSEPAGGAAGGAEVGVAATDAMVWREGISVLAPTPDFSELDRYQRTLTGDVFLRELAAVYSQGPAFKTAVEVHPDHALIRTQDGPYRLWFAEGASPSAPPRYWRPAAEMPISTRQRALRPLAGVHVAIDPGHIGGEWAKMEERWYQIGGRGLEVKEGELTLRVAKLLAPTLRRLGAKVTLVRDAHEPVTRMRPDDFLELARAELAATGQPLARAKARSEIMFYRWSEIRARAAKINGTIKPDVTLCLHFNAESWGDPRAPSLTTRNHLHLLINGTYSNYEFSLHDQRLDLMTRLLQRIHPEELALSSAVADAMAAHTGLPPYVYTRPTAQLVNDNPYVYARNLMANRVYFCPIVFLEPYVMNSREVYDRLAAGDYEGVREIHGRYRKSIFREYADGVATGLAFYYAMARPPLRHARHRTP